MRPKQTHIRSLQHRAEAGQLSITFRLNFVPDSQRNASLCAGDGKATARILDEQGWRREGGNSVYRDFCWKMGESNLILRMANA
jgi:hypothetical protein